jgi:hypothetical protein
VAESRVWVLFVAELHAYSCSHIHGRYCVQLADYQQNYRYTVLNSSTEDSRACRIVWTG